MSIESNERYSVAKRLVAVTLYAVAMGYVESAVVIYIREMAFPDANRVFPLVYLDPRIGLVELGREAATIIMLISVGYIAGKDRFQKWLFFVYAFAIWDIFYYIVLKLVVGWPASILSYDVLFLIPVIWIGPVLTPVLISLLLTIGSAFLLVQSDKSDRVQISRNYLLIFVVGCGIVFFSFTQSSFHVLLSQGPKGLDGYTPQSFDWVAFLIGYFTMCFAVTRMILDSQHRVRMASFDL